MDRRPEKRRRESLLASPCRAHRQPSPQPMHLLLPCEQQTPSQQQFLPRAGKQKRGPYEMDDNNMTDEPMPLNSKEEKEMITEFEGPVQRTKKRLQTGLNWTEMDRTFGLVHVYFYPVQFAVLEI